MASARGLTAVVPAFNEEKSVGAVVRELKGLAKPGFAVDLVVVDDGSKDGTRQSARAAGARVISLPFNLGIGMSVQTGFRFAFERGAEWIVQVDGDGQHDPREISKLQEAMVATGADVVVGSRFIGAQPDGLRSTTWSRWLAGRILAFCVSVITRQRLTDTTSGFRLFNRAAAEFVIDHYPDDYPEVEILVLLALNGFKIAEVPVRMRGRVHGQSSITGWQPFYYVFKVLFASFMDILRIRSRRVR